MAKGYPIKKCEGEGDPPLEIWPPSPLFPRFPLFFQRGGVSPSDIF